MNDLFLSLDSGCISILVLLDPSAAFDTTDHCILLCRLEKLVLSFLCGFNLIVLTDLILSGLTKSPLSIPGYTLEYPKDQFWVLCPFLFTRSLSGI